MMTMKTDSNLPRLKKIDHYKENYSTGKYNLDKNYLCLNEIYKLSVYQNSKSVK